MIKGVERSTQTFLRASITYHLHQADLSVRSMFISTKRLPLPDWDVCPSQQLFRWYLVFLHLHGTVGLKSFAQEYKFCDFLPRSYINFNDDTNADGAPAVFKITLIVFDCFLMLSVYVLGYKYVFVLPLCLITIVCDSYWKCLKSFTVTS